MNAYDFLQAFAETVRDNAAVLAFCKTNFGRGLLVQIDTDAEDLIGSKDAPYFLMKSMPGGDDSPVTDNTLANLLVEAGTTPPGEPPYKTVTTARTALANGLTAYGQGKLSVDLLELCVDAIKAKTIDGCEIVQTATIEADGSIFFPLQVAQSVITIAQATDLSTF